MSRGQGKWYLMQCLERSNFRYFECVVYLFPQCKSTCSSYWLSNGSLGFSKLCPLSLLGSTTSSQTSLMNSSTIGHKTTGATKTWRPVSMSWFKASNHHRLDNSCQTISQMAGFDLLLQRLAHYLVCYWNVKGFWDVTLEAIRKQQSSSFLGKILQNFQKFPSTEKLSGHKNPP